MEARLVTLMLVALVLALVIGGGLGYLIGYEHGSQPAVTTFEECAAAGYPVMESYPERCMTPDGRSFTRVLPPANDDVPPPADDGTPRRAPPEPIACTMDARICPDGSYVGRIGPDCEFAPCP